MKSALEIALEKTKDIKAENDPNALSKEAFEKIRQINKDFDAQIAEMEINIAAKVREMQGSMTQEELQAYLPQVVEDLKTKKDQFNSERNTKIEEIRKKDIESRK
ncbi:MAG TPA: hypothetical protein PLN69_02220 [bacterium]|nr:hypothetical protein [bacterium]